jgi:hypothetical protein
MTTSIAVKGIDVVESSSFFHRKSCQQRLPRISRRAWGYRGTSLFPLVKAATMELYRATFDA